MPQFAHTTTYAQGSAQTRNMHARAVSSLGGTLTSPLGTIGGQLITDGVGNLMQNSKLATHKRGASVQNNLMVEEQHSA